MNTRRTLTQRGWSMLELTLVLVVIAVITSVTLSGRDVLFAAKSQTIPSTFLGQWINTFAQYRRATHRMPGDNFSLPTGFINAAIGAELCNESGSTVTNALSNTFLSANVTLPESAYRQNRPDILLYSDANGLGHTVALCMVTLNRSILGSAIGSYVVQPRPALLLRQIHFSVAAEIDKSIDQTLSTRFGQVRTLAQAGSTVDPTTGADCWGNATSGCSGVMASGEFVDLVIFLE